MKRRLCHEGVRGLGGEPTVTHVATTHTFHTGGRPFRSFTM